MDDHEIRRLAREVFAPLAAAGERGRVNRPLVRALGDTGLLGRLFPTPLGGTGGDGVSATELCRLREALARECTEAETALALQGLGTYPLVQSGSAELAGRWVPAVARGEGVGAFAVGMAEAALDHAVAHARERRAFGRPIGDFQAVSHVLADMATRTRAARLLVYDAARAYDNGAAAADITRLAAMAKLYATE